MGFAAAAVGIDGGTVLILITLLAAPIAAVAFSRSGNAWRSLGKGPLAIDQDLPVRRLAAGPAPPVDPAVQAVEVRQMLEAKAERRRRRGEAPLDVEAETARLLATEPAPAAGDAELRTEVRQLVLARNERRLRQGQPPLDVEAETERQLADFVGSG
jgi:hypothetical protein